MASDTMRTGERFSPRERGWSRKRTAWKEAGNVFPAQAGVIPFPFLGGRTTDGFPRASGGDPFTNTDTQWNLWFSPRERGILRRGLEFAF